MPPSKVRKAPEVIVFEDPDAKIRDSIHRKDKALKKKKNASSSTKNAKGFSVKDHYDEIIEFSKSALTGREKNEYELTKLGAIRHKKGHIPYPIAQHREEVKAKKVRQQRRFEKVNHIVTAVEKKERKVKKEREESILRQPGKYKEGVLYVDPSLLHRK